MKKNEPTPKTLKRRQELLDYIANYRGKYQVSPTMNEMAEFVFGNRSYAGNVLTMLIRPLIVEGFLYKIPGKSNSVMLTSPQPREFYYRETEGKGR